MPRAAILTYHPIHIVDNTYPGNDLVALAADLATIHRLGIRLASLEQLFTPPSDPGLLRDGIAPAVAITFDDGSVFDALDHPHPTCGMQRGAAGVLADAARRMPALDAAKPLASTFVIASPEARAELDRKDYFGGNYWHDGWWQDATASGVLGIESHSWDHNHPSLDRSVQRDNARGTFENVDTFADAEAQIARSLDYIERRCGRRPRFFGYPWGQANAFLVDEYLPRRGVELGLAAAFSSAPTSSGYVEDTSPRWLLPRFVCGHDWKTPQALEALLAPLAR